MAGLARNFSECSRTTPHRQQGDWRRFNFYTNIPKRAEEEKAWMSGKRKSKM